MFNEIADTILISTKCKAKCNHCPFSNPNLGHLFLSRKSIQNILKTTSKTLSIISGGEPFEHPEITEILMDLSKVTNQFRIATGGFIDLKPWIKKLKMLSSPEGPLLGLSMGTDVLSSRVSHSQWVKIWKDNIHLLNDFQIPYSLTFTISTIGNNLDLSRFNIWEWSTHFSIKPQFIYLRYSDETSLDMWIEKISCTFGSIPIIQDKL